MESYDGEGDEMGGASCATHLETDAMGRKKSPQQTKAFAAATAEVTGESKRDINRNVAGTAVVDLAQELARCCRCTADIVADRVLSVYAIRKQS